ncbi:hypothetical protein [Nitrospira moscoviensis]|uniref:YncE family protein n=1 Tax=Nitrospira moscoviensis TaxID=42253 RepID=A0A0K2GIT7_NITMO|nr:hypothetical protein [Nitrospira moscoviensis]ALA60873.1 conserved exported protein of unknown function [Nitrospira moscoviensis]
MKSLRLPALTAALFLIVLLVLPAGPGQAYEVWLTDQSDTGKESGGFLYIYDGAQLAANPPGAKPTQTIDFSGEIGKFCEEATKKAVRRPHMLFFNAAQDHAIVSFLSGQVLFMDAATKKPEACLSMGKNVHAAWPTPDQKMAIAANIAEKKFIRIWTDYKAHKFSFDPEKDVMNLAPMESGERPDTSPICPITEASSRYAFVTLRGGGLLVVDVTATPMKVVATLNNNQVHPAGCGGVQAGGTMYINSGGGWPIAPLSYDVYALDLSDLPKGISARLVSQRDDKFADSHGMVGVGRYVWSADRAGNNVEIIDTLSNLSVGSVDLVTDKNQDPAPDLMDVAPDGQYVFVGLRGPNPLTGNDKTVNNAKGTIPGVGVIHVDAGGKIGHYKGQAAITNMKDGKETADTHGIAVRR